MATLPEGLTQADIDRYAQLDQALKPILEEHKRLNDLIKRSHLEAGISGKKSLVYPSEKYGSVIVNLSERKLLDEETLIEAHPYEKFPQFYSTQFNKTLVDAPTLNKYKTKIVPALGITVGD